MSWLYSRVLVEEYLGDISSDGEPSVQSSGNHTQQAYCSPDKMTECSRLSRFGMTFKPLTDDHGEALLMSYLAAFRAKTSPPPGREQGSTESEVGCGEKWHGSFVRFDPDSCSWKTHQCSLLGDLEPYSETWPRWGLMRNGECWERQMSELRTSETESGLLEKIPTPQARDWKGSSGRSLKGLDYDLPTHVKIWPTPTVNGNNNRPGASKKAGWGLNSAVKLWPTPTTSTGGPQMMGDQMRPSGHKGSNNLAGAVQRWATPVAHPAGGTPEMFLERKRKTIAKGNSMGVSLTDLQMQVIAEEIGMEGRGSLNPMWVEWLMGWPLGWTDLKPLETDRFQKWQGEHGKHCPNE
jgi:hypothetical protein